jgi:hypothetical protein
VQAEESARKSRRVARIFFAVFFLFGTGMSLPFFIWPMVRVVQARGWPTVPCEIVSSQVATHSGDSTTYSVDIVYRYTRGARVYTAKRYQFMGGSSSGYAGKAAVVARFPPGAQATCFVDPANPANAVLERGLTSDMWYGAIPLLFAVIGAIGFVRPFQSGPASARGKSSGVPDRVRRVASGALHSDGVLRPAATRRAKFIGLLIFSLIWNGVVSVFLYNLVRQWGHGPFSWFLMAFLMIFVVIGLAVLVATVRQGLALFNPQAMLTLSPGEIPVGGQARLDWSVNGKIEQLRNLEIMLEGREEATYRRGTDTVTDRNVFASLPIVNVTERAEMQQGWTTLRIPAHTMHSFTAAHNKVVWLLRVRGEIPRWPDLDDEYPITVAPKAARS